jgi:putative ABC transport system permease protein
LWQDLRYGLRILSKNPGFAAIIILSLALGIGANTTIFSIVDAVLLKSLPYQDPDTLICIWGDEKDVLSHRGQVSFTDMTDWRSQNHVFEEVAIYNSWRPILSGVGEAERIPAMLVSDGYFRVMKGKPLLGRAFLPQEQEDGKDFVVVLSNGLWKRRFAADPKIIGRKIYLNLRPYTVVGVMGPDFHSLPKTLSGDAAELYRPAAEPYAEVERGSRHLRAIARLKLGVSLGEAQAEMSAIAQRLEHERPDYNTSYGVRLVPLREDTLGTLQTAISLAFGAVACVLLIACANVANLLLSRLSDRQKEIAIRSSMGAGRARLIRQFLIESLLLAGVAMIVGVLFAIWGNSLIESVGSRVFPMLVGIKLNQSVLLFTVIVSLLTGLAFGIVPAIYGSRVDLNEALKEGGRASGAAASKHRIRNILVVAEVSLSLVLLVGSGLMIRTILNLRGLNPGFNPEKILTMNVWLPGVKYPDDEKRLVFFRSLMQRIQAMPGVQAAGLVDVLPLSGGFDGRSIEIEAQPVPRGQEPDADFYFASPGYLNAMNIPLIRGRFFNDHDTASTQKVAVVSQYMADHFWHGLDPIGKRLRMVTDPNKPDPWFTVVGVVSDVKQRGLEEPRAFQFYYPLEQFPGFAMTLVIRTYSDPAAITSAVQKEIHAIDKDQAVFDIVTMKDVISDSISLRTFLMILLGCFAMIALILATVGIYGVISFSVSQRTHEIGIRMALGADRKDVLRMVVNRGVALTLLGIGIGTVLAIGLTGLMQTLLFDVSAKDPVTFLILAFLLSVVALAASYIPAKRAAGVDPMTALRYQ